MSYFFYQGKTDMRMSFDALSGLVQREMKRNPMSGEVFIFANFAKKIMAPLFIGLIQKK